MIAYTVGLPELILILAVLLLLFGAKKLPELARSLGKSSKAFKEGMHDSTTEEDEEKPGAPPSSPMGAGPPSPD